MMLLRHATRRIATSARAAADAFSPGRASAGTGASASTGAASSTPPHTPPSSSSALPQVQFVGFKAAPTKPALWHPREQWIGLGIVATGVGYGLWKWSQAPPEGEAGPSWERGPA